MLEDQCKGVFRSACEEVVEKHNELCRLRGWPRKPNPFKDFFAFEDKYYVWDGALIRQVMNSRMGNPMRDCFTYFVHAEKLRDAYIKKRYGTVENAMREKGSFAELFHTFTEDFARERERFMDKTAELIAGKALELKKQGKLPQSHGGVANLLKVLTQTMKQQGSSIKTIAKVQYAVCLQAGILIPDEFITDVLVAANIEQEG